MIATTLPNAPKTEAIAQNQRVSSVLRLIAAQIVMVVTNNGTIKLKIDLRWWILLGKNLLNLLQWIVENGEAGRNENINGKEDECNPLNQSGFKTSLPNFIPANNWWHSNGMCHQFAYAVYYCPVLFLYPFKFNKIILGIFSNFTSSQHSTSTCRGFMNIILRKWMNGKNLS